MKVSAGQFGELWRVLLEMLVTVGRPVSPRGKPCREITGVLLELDSSLQNVLINDARKPAYRFMVAEWLWMAFGRNDVATISRYNPNIAAFSDDGKTFDGAYGVPIKQHWGTIVDLLRADPSTRQAVLPIYRPPVQPTKDVPCTISLQFIKRASWLDTFATMRSSDAWLGLPYDVFNFTMLGNILASQVGASPGAFKLFIGSSHLYEEQLERAKVVLKASTQTLKSPRLDGSPPAWLEQVLMGGPLPDRADVWSYYAQALASKTHQEALRWLIELSLR